MVVFKRSFILLFFFCGSGLQGFENPISCPVVDISINARKDALDWNIAGVDGVPNVASELKWNGIKSIGGGATLSALLFSNFPVEMKGSHNRIFAGVNHDLDFFGEDRTGLFLKSRGDASKGELFDLRAEAGMNIPCIKRISLVPHIGYSLDEQHLKEFHGFTEFNFFEPDDIGPIKGLNSGYNARWSGPYIGVKGFIPLLQGILGFGFDYFYPTYRAKGHANLRPDILGPFIHRSRGWGKEIFAEFQSLLQEKLMFEVKLKFGKFWTKRGRESETIQSEIGPVPVKVDLNRVEWKSRSISAHLIKRF